MRSPEFSEGRRAGPRASALTGWWVGKDNMNKKIYNKLIRDKIPEIIISNGGESKTRVLDDTEYLDSLLQKIVEEAEEVKQTKGEHKELIKELGDVQEVIAAIIKLQNLSKEEIAAIQQQRKDSRGGFDQKLFLEYVIEKGQKYE